MAHVIRETRAQYVRDGALAEDPVVADRARPGVVLARIISFITSVILAILALRFVFVLLGANPANGFANFIYTISHPLVAPFFNLFSYRYVDGVARFEAYTLVAMVIYALIGYGLARLLTLNRPARAVEY